MRGAPNSGELFQIGNRIGFIIQIISFAVLLISIQSGFLLHAYAADHDTNFKLMHTLSYVMSAQSLARAPYVVLFNLKVLDGIWQVCITIHLLLFPWQHDLHVATAEPATVVCSTVLS